MPKISLDPVVSLEERGHHSPQLARAQPAGAVVIGGAIGGLGVVRSLGRHGIPVVLLAADAFLARASRYVRGSFPSRAPEIDPDPAAYLLNLAEKHGLQGWTLFPCVDSAVEMVSRNHDRLSRAFRLTTAPWNVLQWAHDKRLTYQRAADLGLDYPRTYCVDSLECAAALDCRFPVILKPAFFTIFSIAPIAFVVCKVISVPVTLPFESGPC